MGYKYKGGTARSVGFEYQTNRPGDERDIVDTFDDLLTVQNVYRLIEIKVDDEGGTKYIWNGLNQADPANWAVTGGGEKGADGADGAPGATGPAGPQGIQGDQGIQGIKGDTGEKGIQGEKGDTGDAGADGSSIVVEGTDTVSNILAKDPTTPNLLWIASDSGTDGLGAPVVPGDGLVSDGIEWINAGPIRGPQGEKGDTGDTGANGSDGLDGAQGIQGDTGVQGPTGPTGLTGDKGDKGDAGEGISIGGTTGQLLIKKTNTNYDTEWADNDAAQKGQNNTFTGFNTFSANTITVGDDVIPVAFLAMRFGGTGSSGIGVSNSRLIYQLNDVTLLDGDDTSLSVGLQGTPIPLKVYQDPSIGDEVGNRDYNDARYTQSTNVRHQIFLTQSEYDALTPDANTFYIING